MRLTHSQVAYLAAAVIMLVFCSLSVADIYKYTDENGNLKFTDDPGKMPKGQDKAEQVYRDTQDNPTETSFTMVNNHIVVPVTVSYRGRVVQGHFVFDTGASSSVISPSIARQLEINPKDAELAVIQGVGGSSVVGSIVLDSISIGPNRANRVEVPVASIGSYDGLLGNDILNRSRFQIDYSARLIRWQ